MNEVSKKVIELAKLGCYTQFAPIGIGVIEVTIYNTNINCSISKVFTVDIIDSSEIDDLLLHILNEMEREIRFYIRMEKEKK